MWELDHIIESWVPKNWWLRIVVLEKTLKSPLESKEIKILKEINPEYSSEGLVLRLKLQYFGHPMWRACSLKWRAYSLEKTLMLGEIKGRIKGNRGGDGWMVSPTLHMSLSKLVEIVKDRESWHAAVQGVTQSWIQLSDWTLANEILPSWALFSCTLFWKMHSESQGECRFHLVHFPFLENVSCYFFFSAICKLLFLYTSPSFVVVYNWRVNQCPLFHPIWIRGTNFHENFHRILKIKSVYCKP